MPTTTAESAGSGAVRVFVWSLWLGGADCWVRMLGRRGDNLLSAYGQRMVRQGCGSMEGEAGGAKGTRTWDAAVSRSAIYGVCMGAYRGAFGSDGGMGPGRVGALPLGSVRASRIRGRGASRHM